MRSSSVCMPMSYDPFVLHTITKIRVSCIVVVGTSHYRTTLYTV
jgi:hypothetical protein